MNQPSHRRAPRSDSVRLDGARLWQRLMTLAAIGATPRGGVCRLALTDLDRQGREPFATWASELGCTLRRDAIGNLFARRAGTEDHLPAVATGSHNDTQPTGGKFDGNYGVLAGRIVAVCAAACAKAQASRGATTSSLKRSGSSKKTA